MKKIWTFILVCVMIGGSVTAYAGSGEDGHLLGKRRYRRGGATVELGINPMGHIWGNHNLLGGVHLSDETSLFMELAYVRSKFPFIGFNEDGDLVSKDVVYTGFSITPEFRYYFDPDMDNDKWFIGGYLMFRVASTDGKPYGGFDSNLDWVQYDLSTAALAPGFTFGYQWATRSGFTVTAWLGLGYEIIYTGTKDPDFEPTDDPDLRLFEIDLNTFNKLDWRGGFTLGWRFD